MSSSTFYNNALFLQRHANVDHLRTPVDAPYSPLITDSFLKSIKKIDRMFLNHFGSVPVAPVGNDWYEVEILEFRDIGSEEETDPPSFDDGDDDVDPVLQRTFNSFGFDSSGETTHPVLVEVLPPSTPLTPAPVFLSRQPTLGRGSAATPVVPQQPMLTSSTANNLSFLPEHQPLPTRVIMAAKRVNDRLPFSSNSANLTTPVQGVLISRQSAEFVYLSKQISERRTRKREISDY